MKPQTPARASVLLAIGLLAASCGANGAGGSGSGQEDTDADPGGDHPADSVAADGGGSVLEEVVVEVDSAGDAVVGPTGRAAAEAVLLSLRDLEDDDNAVVHMWLHPTPVAEGVVLTSVGEGAPAVSLSSEVWLGVIDDTPLAGFDHAVEWVLIDSETLEPTTRWEAWPPVLDGEMWSFRDDPDAGVVVAWQPPEGELATFPAGLTTAEGAGSRKALIVQTSGEDWMVADAAHLQTLAAKLGFEDVTVATKPSGVAACPDSDQDRLCGSRLERQVLPRRVRARFDRCAPARGR